jgi:hypothetical protein
VKIHHDSLHSLGEKNTNCGVYNVEGNRGEGTNSIRHRINYLTLEGCLIITSTLEDK